MIVKVNDLLWTILKELLKIASCVFLSFESLERFRRFPVP